MLPTITKLFASQDRAIRVGLLQNFDAFGPHISASVMDEQVFPQIATGFADSSPFTRELTLKSMLTIVPKVRLALIYLLRRLNKPGLWGLWGVLLMKLTEPGAGGVLCSWYCERWTGYCSDRPAKDWNIAAEVSVMERYNYLPVLLRGFSLALLILCDRHLVISKRLFTPIPFL